MAACAGSGAPRRQRVAALLVAIRRERPALPGAPIRHAVRLSRPRPPGAGRRGRGATKQGVETMTLGWILWFASLMPQPAADSVCLGTTGYLEARNQSLRGQQAVAEAAPRR